MIKRVKRKLKRVVLNKRYEWKVVGDKYADTTISIVENRDKRFDIISIHKFDSTKNEYIMQDGSLKEFGKFIEREKRFSSRKLINAVENYAMIIATLAKMNERYSFIARSLDEDAIDSIIKQIKGANKLNSEIGRELFRNFIPLDYKAKDYNRVIMNKLTQYNGYTKIYNEFILKNS